MEVFPAAPDGDRNRGPLCIQVDAVLTSFAISTTVLRVATRLHTRHQGWDDFAIVFGLVFNVADFAINILQVQSGFGRHAYYLTTDQLMAVTKWDDIGQILSFTAIGSTKIAICLFLLRLQQGKSLKWLKWFLWFLIIGLVITSGSNVVVLLSRCQPFDALWTGRGRCWNINTVNGFNYSQLAYSIFSDLACSAMPIILVWNLQMKRRLKIVICTLTMLGLAATACAIARAALLPATKSPDVSWSLVDLSIWVRAEDNIAIIAANLAISRAFCKLVHTHVSQIISSVRAKSQNDVSPHQRLDVRGDPKLEIKPKSIPLDGMRRFLLKENTSLHTSNYCGSTNDDIESSHSEQQEIPQTRSA